VTNDATVDKLLYTPVEAAHTLGVSRSTIYVLMAGANLPLVRIGSSRRIPSDELRHRRVPSAKATLDATAAGRGSQLPRWGSCPVCPVALARPSNR
jgi:excisionase family DNA binding protein